MAIISQDTWDNMPIEEREWIIKEYNSDAGEGHSMLGKLFGKENLQPKPKIRTWEDVEKSESKSGNPNTNMLNFLCNTDKKIQEKCAATLKIAKLIELGYGGMVTDEEWKILRPKYYISIYINDDGTIELDEGTAFREKYFIAFHTP